MQLSPAFPATAEPALPPPLAARFASLAELVPFLRPAFARAYRRYFNGVAGHARLFRGIYPTFAAAAQAIPPGRPCGYDNPASAQRLSHDRFCIYPCDYPVLFWLSQLLPECHRLFDWGGNVGTSYFAYRKYLSYAFGLQWVVNDVPAVVTAGRELASGVNSPGLRFTSRLDELAQSDLLLASGSLHFIDDPFGELRRLPALPRHVLLSKVPAYDLPAAVTLQNMGTAFCPNHLFNRDRFVETFERLGYRLVDEWRSPDLSCRIPFYRRHSVSAYSGFYFRRPSP